MNKVAIAYEWNFLTDMYSACRSILSRTALVSDLSSKGVVNLVSDEVRQIYSLLEADFTPLELCQRLAPLLKQLESVTETMSGGFRSQLQCRCLQRWVACSRTHHSCFACPVAKLAEFC